MNDNLPPLPPEGFVWNDPEHGDIPAAYTAEQMKAYARAAIERQSVPADFETTVREYIDEYEMLGETEDGRDACYTPNENDKALLFDAFMGFDFSPWLGAAPQPQPVQPEGPMAETVEQAARDVAKCLNERDGQGLDLRHVAMLVHYAQQPVQQEPVAWRFPKAGIDNGYHYTETLQGEESRFLKSWEPLFTPPQAAQPLSEERVREIYESTSGLDFYRNFARAIEQAHGITKGTT